MLPIWIQRESYTHTQVRLIMRIDEFIFFGSFIHSIYLTIDKQGQQNEEKKPKQNISIVKKVEKSLLCLEYVEKFTFIEIFCKFLYPRIKFNQRESYARFKQQLLLQFIAFFTSCFAIAGENILEIKENTS